MSAKTGLSAFIALVVLVLAASCCPAGSARSETTNAAVESTAASAPPAFQPAVESTAAMFPAAAPSAAGESAVPPAGGIIKLPQPKTSDGMGLNDTLSKRRSIRSLGGPALTREQLSQLLWSAQGITEPRRGLRTAPSAMARYPLEVFAVTGEGAFQYLPAEHAMKMVKAGDNRQAITGQGWASKAPLEIVIVSVPERMQRAGDRAKTWIPYEAGAAAQNVLLEATAMGLGSGTVGGFNAANAASVLGLSENMEVLIVLPIGAIQQ